MLRYWLNITLGVLWGHFWMRLTILSVDRMMQNVLPNRGGPHLEAWIEQKGWCNNKEDEVPSDYLNWNTGLILTSTETAILGSWVCLLSDRNLYHCSPYSEILRLGLELELHLWLRGFQLALQTLKLLSLYNCMSQLLIINHVYMERERDNYSYASIFLIISHFFWNREPQ